MASSAMKIVFGLLSLVTVGMIIGSLFQLAFLHKLEDSYGFAFSRKIQRTHVNSYLQLPTGIPIWANDKEASILRLGFVKPEVISWSPRIIVFHNFLSMEECDYIRAIALPRLQVSTVVDTKTGKGIKSDVRTSSGMFLTQEERKYPMIQAIEKRISVYSQVPVENGELIQVLRYEKNEFYRPHHDYFSDTFNVKRGGQRIATMLMYLSDNVDGGETYFPLAGSGECSCGGKTVRGFSIKPVKGDAVLFWSMGLDGQPDANSVHGGCDVLTGEKCPHPSIYRWSKQPAVATPCNGYYRQATKPTSYCSISINTKHQRNLGLFNQKVVTTKSAYSLNHFNSYEVTAAWSSRPAQPSKTEEKLGNALSKAASGFISPNGQCFSNSKGKKTGTTSENPMHVSIVAKLQP
ncbi:hypothetical protein Nepgr_024796 [Nepenthes gracilis]|uniref:Fe2OG dioxygenase domain-containing protein n=1 Tax=Nepenthes gracilis TaxID=150966 RepID=A0AAD3T3I8_NEPGR|nr:hypothetical protein Nepgr_024796 [Nepenthes gracilis]